MKYGKALNKAIKENNLEVIKGLLTREDIMPEVNLGIQSVPLWGTEEVLRLLLEKRPHDYALESCLLNAIFQKKAEMYKMVLAFASNLNKERLLLVAVNENAPLFVKLLLDEGADINFKNEESQTPLGEAIRKNDKQLVKILINRGADLNQKCYDTRYPLDLASKYHFYEIIEMLKEKGAREIQPEEMNIKECAGKNYYKRVFQLSHKASRKDLSIALALSANRGHFETVDVLLKNEFTKQELDKAILASCSAGYGRKEIVQALIEKGADPKSKEEYGGFSVCQWARQFNQADIVELLNRYDIGGSAVG